jgi:hypothetical protein
METALRALQAQSATDRQALGNLLRDVQTGLQALRSETAHAEASDRQVLGDLMRDVQTGFRALRSEGVLTAADPHAADKIQALQALLEAKLGDLDSAMGSLSERLPSIQKLAAASDSWDELRTHMETVEGRVGSQTLDVANRIADAFSQRLSQTEAALQLLQEETERHWSSDGERQIALEASVRAHLQGAEEAAKKQERDLGEIYQALVKLGANQQTLGDNFTAWRIETGGDIGIVNNGLQRLEQTTLDLLGHLGSDLHALREETRAGRGGLFYRFKRWLFGTSNVLEAGWREHTPTTRETSAAAPKEELPGSKVELKS